MKLLLLIQNQADVDNLTAASKAILNSSITGVWTVFSPAITVDSATASAKFDAEIEQLRTAERAAAERGDYEAAGGYKTQREGKELDRAKALRDAWKTANEDDRKARTKEIFQPFTEALQKAKLSVRVTGHSDHYEREQWVALLNSLSGVWFKPFTPGSFIVSWPEAVVSSLAKNKLVVDPVFIPQLQTVEKPVPEQKLKSTEPAIRQAELSEFHTNKLRAMAAGFGISTEGKDKPTLASEIVAAEAAAKAEPALAEY